MTTLSASSVNTYEECHLQWYFTYVEMRPEPPNEPRETGTIVHDYAEWALKTASARSVGELPEGKRVSVEADVAALFDLFKTEVLPTYGNPVLVEAAFELDVEGITYTGFIDSVDQHPIKPDEDTFAEYWAAEKAGKYPTARYILRDLKTTKNRPRKGKYRTNMVGYYLGARELGYKPDTLLLDYLVRTQKPYYWPEEQEVPDEDEIDMWVAKVEAVANGIERGDYEPTGVGTYVCNYCPFKDICGPYDRWHEMTSPLRKE